jgi:hypothetical protein
VCNRQAGKRRRRRRSRRSYKFDFLSLADDDHD